MSTTIGQNSALFRLESLVSEANASSIYAKLRTLSLTPSNRKFVGAYVAFIATRERTGILSLWAEESRIAGDLELLGRAAWADTQLLHELHPVGEELLVSRELRGFLISHYLAAMAAARRALPDDAISTWIERLRMFLLIRAIEAGDAGVLREAHLLSVCTELRQICEITSNPKRAWMAQLVHSLPGFFDFVDETKFKCKQVLNSKALVDQAARSFFIALLHVLESEWTALSDYDTSIALTVPTTPGTFQAPSTLPFSFSAGGMKLAPFDVLPDLPPDTAFYIGEEADEAQSFTIAEVETQATPPAQRRQGTGILLQALEETQYLRHSWHRLSEKEEHAFLLRTVNLLKSTAFEDRLGAALISLAMLTSNSASSVSSIPIHGELQDDWSLDLQQGQLRRSPPRFGRRWRADAVKGEPAFNWVRRQTKEWRISLSEQLVAPLREAKRKRLRSKTLKDLWWFVSPTQPLEIWFAHRFAVTEDLERLTSPVIATMLAQHAFDQTHDHALARLIGSSTRTGLPSACAYGAYVSREVSSALDGAISLDLAQLVSPDTSDDDNAAGSELDLDLDRVRREIVRISRNIDITRKDSGRWVEHHNQLCTLCVLALLASTGARPVTSPFESLSWIDFAARLIYVEDKHSGPSRGSRLCVLCDFAHDLLTQHFLPHLAQMAQGLASSAPEFSAEISKILSRDPECRLPLFFFLRAEPTLDWIEVSESQLSRVCDERWPLPWNLFRHLHSTQLRRWGLHPEIRDALMAHGDRGAESHGDFSWRVPREDLQAAKPLVNRLMSLLGFVLPERMTSTPQINYGKCKDPGLYVSRTFGREARAEQRERSHAAAQRMALADIERELAGRPPSSLNAQEWDQIARAMLMRDNGLPHSSASLRYEVFEQYLTTNWRDQAIHSKLRRRYIPIRDGSGLFVEEAIGANEQLVKLRDEFDALAASFARRAPRPVLAACLAAIDLALFSRVDNFAALSALICNLPTVRLIRFTGRFWFEWSYRGDWVDGRPVYRVPVTDRAAGWIEGAQTNIKQLDKLPEIPQALLCIVKEVAPDIGRFIKQLAKLVSQVNAFELPGTVAAILNGRRQCAALPHADWIRTTSLCAPLAIGNASQATTTVETTEGEEHFFRHHHRAPLASQSATELTRCRELFDAIQRQIENASKSTVRERTAEIARLVKASGFVAGDAPYVLAHYITHLLKRPKKSGGQGALRTSTTLRYWYSLSGGFLDFAATVNLTALDEEEITELYADIVNADMSKPSKSPSTQASENIKKPKPSSIPRESNSRERTLIQLEEIHEFAREIYGLEDPDWSEISPGKLVGSGRPGIVLMPEYQAVLAGLVSGIGIDALSDDLLRCAFVLIVCARFGLRLGEAVGLHRDDWLDTVGTVVVLVRSNGTRGLKTNHSKRQVPLVGLLGSNELTVVEEVLTRWNHQDGVKHNSPLLPGVNSDSFKAAKADVSGRLLPLIKGVTRNPANTVHQLRHGFATGLLATLCALEIGKGIQFNQELSIAARKLLLGADDTDRRTLWAIARMLGHASPATTLKAYVHGLDAWLPAPVKRAAGHGLDGASGAVDLDSLQLDSTYLERGLEATAAQAPAESLFLRYLRYLRLRSIGQSADAASSRSRLARAEAEVLDLNMGLAAQRLTRTAQRALNMKELLAGVATKRWTVLVQLAQASQEVTKVLDGIAEWEPTVGASRQIILFDARHFTWMRVFLSAMSIDATQCKLIVEQRLHPDVMQRLVAAKLNKYVKKKEEWGPNFQLDRAVFGSPPLVARDRVAAIPCPEGPVSSTFEFLILWVAWITAQIPAR
jgi:integrase